jgi:uroporphyrin-III C-methyltransferase
MTVYLVGAGPGDPDLLTVKGARLLQNAQVVIFDRLISPEIMALANPAAILVDAGKRSTGDSGLQDDINAWLVEYGRQYETVVRLKGGDPFVFGRGGEEILACKEAGIPVEVVPGISSAIAAPAYAGIPVTHRAVSTSFTVVTGSESPEKESSTLDYAALAKMETLVFLMAVKALPQITAALIQHGRPPETPVACIESGTLPEQRLITGTLATIPEIAAGQALKAPAIIVIGEVAALAQSMAWRHDKEQL